MLLGQKTRCQDLGSYPFLLTSTFCSAIITLGSSANPLTLGNCTKILGKLCLRVCMCTFGGKAFSHHQIKGVQDPQSLEEWAPSLPSVLANGRCKNWVLSQNQWRFFQTGGILPWKASSSLGMRWSWGLWQLHRELPMSVRGKMVCSPGNRRVIFKCMFQIN